MSRYRFIAAEKATYPVSLLCRTLGPSARQRADQQLLEQISKIHRASRDTYGAHASTPSSATTTGCGSGASGWPG